jgi:hypothetical protein
MIVRSAECTRLVFDRLLSVFHVHQAMEADMEQRRLKRESKYQTANRCKDRGNALLKQGDFAGAIEEYSDGLTYARDYKALWTNKALAELKLARWRDCQESCSKVGVP